MLPTNMGGKGAKYSVYYKEEALKRCTCTSVDTCELCVGLIYKRGEAAEGKLCMLIRLMVWEQIHFRATN